MLLVACCSIFCCCAECCSAKCCFDQCCSVLCCCAEWHFTECCYDECRSVFCCCAECCFAKCCYDECCCAECLSDVVLFLLLRWMLFFQVSFCFVLLFFVSFCQMPIWQMSLRQVEHLKLQVRSKFKKTKKDLKSVRNFESTVAPSSSATKLSTSCCVQGILSIYPFPIVGISFFLLK